MAGALAELAFGKVWAFARPQASKRSGATSWSGQRVGKGIAAFYEGDAAGHPPDCVFCATAPVPAAMGLGCHGKSF
jgi:hypothetical protein